MPIIASLSEVIGEREYSFHQPHVEPVPYLTLASKGVSREESDIVRERFWDTHLLFCHQLLHNGYSLHKSFQVLPCYETPEKL